MKLACFNHRNQDRIGVLVDDKTLIDLAAVATVAKSDIPDGLTLPTKMEDLVRTGTNWLDVTARLLHFAQENPDKIERIGLQDVSFLPPVARPGKIVGVPLNNSAADARKISGPDHPMFFLKPSSCLIGHGQDIVVRPHYGGLHPEPELGVIIGGFGKDLDAEAAEKIIAGYTIFNDMTGNHMRAEDRVHYYALYANPENPDELERREQHLSYAARYKGSDGFGPVGPYLVTPDEISDPMALDVVCTVNGEIIAQDSTAYLTYSVGEIIAFLSWHMTLEPGDMISMGTAFRPAKDSKRSLHTADLSRIDGPVEISITGLGTLCNGVRRDDTAMGQWRRTQ